jgi:hypothetical protein
MRHLPPQGARSAAPSSPPCAALSAVLSSTRAATELATVCLLPLQGPRSATPSSAYTTTELTTACRPERRVELHPCLHRASCRAPSPAAWSSRAVEVMSGYAEFRRALRDKCVAPPPSSASTAGPPPAWRFARPRSAGSTHRASLRTCAALPRGNKLPQWAVRMDSIVGDGNFKQLRHVLFTIGKRRFASHKCTILLESALVLTPLK